MIEVTRVIKAAPADVLAVLTDGWTYASWVVGASTIRDVDPGFPAPDSRIHHSFGSWPLLLEDTTHVLEYEPGRRLKLEARGWPLGQATVEITVEPAPASSSATSSASAPTASAAAPPPGSGPVWDAESTLVTMTEDASAGPGKLVPQPLRQLAIAPRNRESLRRLAYLAEGHAFRAGE